MKIGVISDTHGSLPAATFEVFKNVDQIWHAGDIGSMNVITELETIAPVTAVTGNTDTFPIISQYSDKELIQINTLNILLTHVYLNHNLRRFINTSWEFDKHFNIIVFGHTHQPMIHQRETVLYFNPGSPRLSRASGVQTLGIITINQDNSIEPQIVNIK